MTAVTLNTQPSASQQEEDAFNMKRIIMLKAPHKNLSPIQVKAIKENDNKWVIILSQSFQTESGEKKHLEGRFIRHATSDKSAPISFKFTEETLVLT